MKLLLGKDFPASPPKGYFLTKIFHPNVGANGEICVNVLKRDWTAELGIRHVLLVSFSLVLCWDSKNQLWSSRVRSQMKIKFLAIVKK